MKESTHQGGGGMPFVASSHPRVLQCFRFHGNLKHESGGHVSLEEFQRAVRARHCATPPGESMQTNNIDFCQD